MTSRQVARLSSALLWRIPPLTGVVDVDGRLGAVGVDNQVLLLQLGLEMNAGSGPHIGQVYINEVMGGMLGWLTFIVGPGLDTGHRGLCSPALGSCGCF